MRHALWLLPAIAAVAAVGAAAGTGSDDGGDDGAGRGQSRPTPKPPVVGCNQRSEPSPRRFDRRRDVVRGPFALISIRGVERRPASSFVPEDGRLAGTKFPAALRAGRSAVVRIAEPDQAHAALLVRAATREARSLREGDVAVRYVPCRPDTPRFGGRASVGLITGWAGALIVTGPRCVTLEVTVDGRRQRDVRLRLGARCS